MPRGRTPKPTALKLLAGAQPCRVNADEPRPAPGEPTAPAHLAGEALAEWRRIVPKLVAMGILTEADGPALAIYTVAYARWIQARAEVERRGLMIDTTIVKASALDADGNLVEVEHFNPRGCVKPNAAVAIVAAAEATMARILGTFGLTPADRSRVKAVGSSAGTAAGGKLARFMPRKKA